MLKSNRGITTRVEDILVKINQNIFWNIAFLMIWTYAKRNSG